MDNYISWNVPNWITVVLMVGVGWTLFGFVQSGLKSALGNPS